MSNPFSSTPSLDPEAGFSNQASAVAQAANDLRAAAGEKAREFVQTAEAKAAVLKDKAVEKAENFKSAATDKAQYIKESATEHWNDTRVKAKEYHGTAEDYIRQNPTKSVLVALGAGFLIGLIARR